MNSNLNSSKNFTWLFSVLMIVLAIFVAFSAQLPSADNYQSGNEKEFSQQNALKHLKVISAEAHYVGAPAHTKVRKYLVDELEALGLEVETFKHLSTHGRRTVAAYTNNIITKIKGTTEGKALALVSHYDSGTHSSLGASDAGSGVVTILEAVRTFLANGKQPTNDIIIVLTDAEEQGLLGAGAFVNFHPWAKDIGLVLNFEARGSGGPSYMLIETNGGNKRLIQAFREADINIPVANSLMYALYKLLPNSTDLTVFRKQADIDGLNFAFIDDHFDYHTVQDSWERIDRESLNHQADYLMSSLNYFAYADLSQLKSEQDMVYFNFPGLNMVIYPNSWVTPMLLFATLLFVLLCYYGFKQNSLTIKQVALGFAPLFTSLVLAGSIGYFGWQLLLSLFPQYADIPHGFTYNGHWILACFVTFTCATTLFIYQLFNKKLSSSNLFVAPIVLWLCVNVMIALMLPGAGFFILPLYLALACFGLNIFSQIERPKQLMLGTLLVIPSVMLLTPLIPLLVIGLGLKMSVIGTLLTCMTLILLIPIYCNYPKGNRLAIGFSMLSLLFLVISIAQSDYTEERKKPNSVNYVYDQDTDSAFMTSYNRTLDAFTNQFFDKESSATTWDESIYPQSRRTKVRFYQATDKLDVKAAKVEVIKDELTDKSRILELLISPQREVNIIQLASNNEMPISKLSVNGQAFNSQAFSSEPGAVKEIKKGFFFKYVLTHSHEKVSVELVVPKNTEVSLKVFETSFDLLERLDDVQARDSIYMPEPFVINDAVIIGQSVKI